MVISSIMLGAVTEKQIEGVVIGISVHVTMHVREDHKRNVVYVMIQRIYFVNVPNGFARYVGERVMMVGIETALSTND